MSDTYTCKHCGVTLHSLHMNHEANVFTGEVHTVSSCRDKLFAELTTLRAKVAAGERLREAIGVGGDPYYCGCAEHAAAYDAAVREGGGS